MEQPASRSALRGTQANLVVNCMLLFARLRDVMFSAYVQWHGNKGAGPVCCKHRKMCANSQTGRTLAGRRRILRGERGRRR
jgi:hypothetical protein